MKTREEQLKSWRAARAKPLGHKSNTVAAAQKANLPDKSFSQRTKHTSHKSENKENIAIRPRPTKSIPHSSAGWKRATESQLDVLSSTLRALKRDSLRPAITGKMPTAAQLEESSLGKDSEHSPGLLHNLGQSDVLGLTQSLEGSGMAQEAAQLFGDTEFLAAFEQVQGFQLQRTRNGATEQSRIIELAGLAKLARRVLKELKQRTATFVSKSIEQERHTSLLAEAAELNAESVKRSLEAEVAALKCEAAQAAAAAKTAAAAFALELNMQRSEAAHARQELVSAKEQRDAALSEASRHAAVRAELEARQWGNAADSSADMMHDKLRVAVDEAQARKLACQHLEAQQQEALAYQTAAQAEAVALRDDLICGQQERDALKAELESNNLRIAAAQASMAELQQQNANKLAAAAAQQRSAEEKAALMTTRYERLVQDQGQYQDVVEEYEQRLHCAQSSLQAAQHEAEQAQSQLQVYCNNLVEHGAVLADEKAQLKNALALALQHKNMLEASLQAVRQELQEQHSHVAQLQCSIDQQEAKCSQAAAAQEAIARQLQQERESTEELTQQAAERASRLARIEGEMGALQDAMGTGSMDQADMLSRLISRVATLDQSLGKSQAAERDMHNKLMELRGNVRVFCRVRPAAGSCVSCLPDGCSLQVEDPAGGKSWPFSFDHTFGPTSSQAAVFAQVSELVRSALDGYQVCLFSYGQTGAGKTHTMEGSKDSDGHGIIPRAFAKILEHIRVLQGQGWEYTVEASYIEVYNETLRDLLTPRGRHAGHVQDINAVRHDPNGGHTHVAGTARVQICCQADAESLMGQAHQARAVASTAMNAQSSRSHSVLMLHISGSHEATGTRLQGSLNLVDLAGSERLARSGVEGQHAKEACLINKSLSALGDVFTALAAKSPHVPHRNSKLTHLLQPCLGGSGKTLMIVNVNPEPASQQETLCALRFAAKVNACETRAAGGACRHVFGGKENPPNSQAQPQAQARTKRKLATCVTRAPRPRIH